MSLFASLPVCEIRDSVRFVHKSSFYRSSMGPRRSIKPSGKVKEESHHEGYGLIKETLTERLGSACDIDCCAFLFEDKIK